MKKCFIYHRVSSEIQLAGAGIQRQADNLEAYVERTNLLSEMEDPEATIISDQGVSAFKGLNMSEGELGRWMEQVRAGMWDGSALVLESIDRFSRQNPFTVVAYLSELVNHNITIHDVSLNMLINRTNSAMLPIVTMSAQRAYEESKIKSDRIRDGWRRKRENAFNNGTIVTNKRPQWIDVQDDKYVLNDKVAIVREIFRLYQTGIGTPTIAKLLNAKGDEWLFESGRLWRGESVHKILKNKRVTGTIFISEIIRDYNSTSNPVDQKTYEMDVYPISIPKEEFDLVQQLLKTRRPNNGRITTSKETDELKKGNIFNSVCRCARCGEAMYHNVVLANRDSKKNGKFTEEYRYIRCIGERDGLCENKALRYEVVEQFVIEHIKGMDFTQILKPNEINPEIELVRQRIEEEKAHIQEYELGIERLKNQGKKVPFDVLTELEDSRDKLKELEERQSTFTEVQVDTDYLKTVDPSVLFDQTNIEVRSRIERELSKVIDTIQLYRTGKHYVITLKYRNVDVLKHVLFVEAKKEPVLISGVAIERMGSTVAYSTPSFSIAMVDGDSPRLINIEGEPLSIIDYSLLLNYVDAVDRDDVVGVWMRNKFNSIFALQ
ncbi:recombinase family protein [Enterobacter ludwigii]|uniref:recombinase family protein n=1 Tax=Enterobacter ludwigii TaxID=299767 RepID=UPI002FD6F8D9